MVLPMLLGALGLDKLGIDVPGAELMSSPVTAFDKNKDLDISTFISLLCSCMCSAMIVQRMIGFPFKSPPIIIALALCCVSSILSTTMLTKDTYDRFTRKSE
jgi:hypothetical protein